MGKDRERSQAEEQGVHPSVDEAENAAAGQSAKKRTNGIAGRALSVAIRILIVTLLILVTVALIPTRG